MFVTLATGREGLAHNRTNMADKVRSGKSSVRLKTQSPPKSAGKKDSKARVERGVSLID